MSHDNIASSFLGELLTVDITVADYQTSQDLGREGDDFRFILTNEIQKPLQQENVSTADENTTWEDFSHTLFVTERANFLSGVRSLESQRTEEYIRSISTAIFVLDT
jgi:hypothetical protein